MLWIVGCCACDIATSQTHSFLKVKFPRNDNGTYVYTVQGVPVIKHGTRSWKYSGLQQSGINVSTYLRERVIILMCSLYN